MQDTNEYYLINQLSLITGLTDRTLRNYISAGILEGEKVNGTWHFTIEQIEAFITLTMTRVWLNTYLGDVERALAPNMKAKNIRLVCKAEAKRVILETDLVKSLLYNLVDNASKAMDNGGIIAVHGIAIPGGCQFQVVDNGRGMEPAELTKITEAFYRVDKARSRSQGGAGLGLALCKQIVELHNGSIQFASTPGKGTRVTVTLYGKAGSADG